MSYSKSEVSCWKTECKYLIQLYFQNASKKPRFTFLIVVWKVCGLYYKYSYANYDQILTAQWFFLAKHPCFNAAMLRVPHFKTRFAICLISGTPLSLLSLAFDLALSRGSLLSWHYYRREVAFSLKSQEIIAVVLCQICSSHCAILV